ncbi:MAG: zinc-binding dehydrogenase [Anaerolineae bacterium]|jgi:NADPH:quinone reductase-like Zn-dependent oxidoreductase|nr:zinc-binding dehydrogenase [Anaerolineae bacterium]
MRGAVITGHGGPEVVEVVDNLPIPQPKRGEVRLKMKAAALNRLDLWVRLGWPGLNLPMPHIMCADGAGVVDALGEDVTQFGVGDRVCIDPTIVDADSPALMTGLENQSRIHILGESVAGVACEYAVLPVRNLMKMPDHVTYEQAAAAGLVYLTAWHSLITRGGLRAGESVLIVGAGGGVNSASIQIAKLAGAKVYVVGSNAEKCQKATELGADVTINREATPNWSKEMYKMTNKQGVDVVIDNVGTSTFNDSIRATRIGGRILVVGNTSGPFVELDLRQVFARQISIIGSTMGPHQDYIKVMNLVFSGALKPVIGAIFPLEEAHKAQDTLAEFEVFGKVVLKIED